MTRPGPGKFEGNSSQEASEVLYAWVQNGLIDDQCGDSDVGWHGFLYVAEGDQAYDRLREAEAELVTSPELGIVVHEDSNGFFSYEIFESSEAARIVFDEWQKEIEGDLAFAEIERRDRTLSL